MHCNVKGFFGGNAVKSLIRWTCFPHACLKHAVRPQKVQPHQHRGNVFFTFTQTLKINLLCGQSNCVRFNARKLAACSIKILRMAPGNMTLWPSLPFSFECLAYTAAIPSACALRATQAIAICRPTIWTDVSARTASGFRCSFGLALGLALWPFLGLGRLCRLGFACRR